MRPEHRSLREWLAAGAAGRVIRDATRVVALADFAARSGFGVGAAPLIAARNVMLAIEDQLTAAAALIELDGLARRIVVCPPGLDLASRAVIATNAGVETIVVDAEGAADAQTLVYRLPLGDASPIDAPFIATEWALLTSGTSGPPKLAAHDLSTLTGVMAKAPPPNPAPRWATYYDIRRYGGMQILLRALTGGESLTLTQSSDPIETTLKRLNDSGVTHITGTPTHWRKVLMSGAARRVDPAYVRLSGEIVDDAVLNGLKGAYPRARIVHAYASTEAGVGFEVTDGEPGFPASFLDARGDGAVEMRIVDGSLHLRSRRTALRYIGGDSAPITNEDGFIDSGDMVERRGDRFYFTGRRGGVINVGGSKVHPEEVENVINAQPGVRISLVKARKNPITGAAVVADVVVQEDCADSDALRARILDACRASLAAYKVPMVIRFVPSLDTTPGGKLARLG
jgi:acyl-coenzyme A synthetase/AMP-(fatty) acid ligase